MIQFLLYKKEATAYSNKALKRTREPAVALRSVVFPDSPCRFARAA